MSSYRSMIIASAPLDEQRIVPNPTSDHDALNSQPFVSANLGGTDTLAQQTPELTEAYLNVSKLLTPEKIVEELGPSPHGDLNDWLAGSMNCLRLETRFVSPVFNGANDIGDTMRTLSRLCADMTAREAARLVADGLTMPGWSKSHQNPSSGEAQQRYNTKAWLYLYALIAKRLPDDFFRMWEQQIIPTTGPTSPSAKIAWLESIDNNNILFLQEATTEIVRALKENGRVTIHHDDVSRPFCLVALPPGTSAKNISIGPRCACAQFGGQVFVSWHGGYSGCKSDIAAHEMCKTVENLGLELVIAGDFNYGKAKNIAHYRKEIHAAFNDPIFISADMATRKPDTMSIWDPQAKRTPK